MLVRLPDSEESLSIMVSSLRCVNWFISTSLSLAHALGATNQHHMLVAVKAVAVHITYVTRCPTF